MNTEVHICPILMHTVIWENWKCKEVCGAGDCPIAFVMEDRKKEELGELLQRTTFEGLMEYEMEGISEDGYPAPLYDGEVFFKGICNIFALVLYKEFGYQPLKTKDSDGHYFCTGGKRYIDACGWEEEMSDPITGQAITEYEPMDVLHERREIEENKFSS